MISLLSHSSLVGGEHKALSSKVPKGNDKRAWEEDGQPPPELKPVLF